VDVQFPWESEPTNVHDHTMAIRRFYLDQTPVTCGAYAAYLAETIYRPRDDHNFLKNWRTGGNATVYTPPTQLLDLPVTYISLREARDYCEHYGKRLPASFEWSYAAQGMDGRPYPWGNESACATNGTCCPALTSTYRNASSVWAHPKGASPFGMLDMVGNVWQFTDEFVDEHTRAAIVRGGSFFAPRVPAGDRDWYFPNGAEMRRLDAQGKYFLMDDSYERCGTIGFRCAADALG
jgi:formylglycine-generating enzyme required for sulfatase activity